MKSTIWAIATIESLLVLFFCIYSAWRYAAKGRTPFYVYFFTILGWLLGLMIIFLIPLDIFTVKFYHEVDSFLVIVWGINYWTVFVLTWFLIPFMIEYLGSGDFTAKDKAIRAFKNNVPVLIAYVVTFLIVVIILSASESGRDILKKDGILGCIIGITLVFGLLSIVILLGFGIVKIPLYFFKYASNKNRLKYYQIQAAEYDGKLNAKVRKVQSLIQVVKQVQVQMEIEQYKSVLLNDVDKFLQQTEEEDFKISTSLIVYKISKEFTGVLDYDKLIRLRQRLKYLTTDILRLLSFKREAIENAIFTQDVMDSATRNDKVIRSYYAQDRDDSKLHNRMINSISYYWYAKLKRITMLILSLVFTSLSIIILYAEITSIFGVQNNIIYNIVTQPDFTASYLAQNIVCLIPLIYLMYATYYGMFKLKVSNIYALHRNHHTDPSCLLYSSMVMMRLSVPIVYNFLELTKTEKAAAYVVMGPAKYVNFLGTGFNQFFFPVCLILMVILTALNIYGRILNFIGLKQYAFDTGYAQEQVDDGRYIIEQYKQEKLHLIGRQNLIMGKVEADGMAFTGLNSTEGQALLNQLGEGNSGLNQNSSRMSTTTFNLDNDEEYEARKGIRGIFNKLFKKKQ